MTQLDKKGQIIEIVLNGINRCKSYLQETDLVVFIVLTIIVLYFLMYIVSFFFKLPVIILFGILIGYYLYINKDNNVKKI